MKKPAFAGKCTSMLDESRRGRLNFGGLDFLLLPPAPAQYGRLLARRDKGLTGRDPHWVPIATPEQELTSE
jgi:hypothetical protein